MKILLLGGGGREHCLAWKISQSPHCEDLYIAPGNGGTAALGRNVDLNPEDIDAVKTFCVEEHINMVVVGPEAPLVAGITDAFFIDPQTRSIHIVGPSRHGARLEGSKSFAKAFMQRHGIPTARYRAFSNNDLEEGLEFISESKLPVVLKADGLAAGKGVLICQTKEEAETQFRAMLEGKFGAASETVVIEEFLEGIEFSVFILTDGHTAKMLPVAKDYKRIGEGDTGLNTGGMGSVSPVPFVDDVLLEKVQHQIIDPTLAGIREENIRYRGFIFFGLIKVGSDPYVIEYNCRLGDPETQVVIPRLGNDIVRLFQSLFDGSLAAEEIRINKQFATAVVLASGGYPGSYEKGRAITLPNLPEDTLIFHAGTREGNGQLLTSGGRVMAAVGKGETLQGALGKANALAEQIRFEGKYYRKDIGFDL